MAMVLIAASDYLYAASRGSAAWFHHCNRNKTVNEFMLRLKQRLLNARTTGHPSWRDTLK